jgi:hypothetical protein
VRVEKRAAIKNPQSCGETLLAGVNLEKSKYTHEKEVLNVDDNYNQ